MVITFDEPKRDRNLRALGLDLADARARFEWRSAMIYPGHPSKYGKPRLVAVGLCDGELRALVFQALGNEAVAPISFRPASNRERDAYDARP
ncbi:BrnT family toxin [Methylobacterium trifolii]|uniref:BrnT family toxin n=1 Tax=Methylobacterium trifolii TaxID=1003092 RepID=A0ABQ4U3T9_9HYPH|nr:BrnT family toxin [Methylobacterium trifolii]GJE62128.1 hypothetical protein MPOCJGCO_4258 [Methylobacterium trifolii]